MDELLSGQLEKLKEFMEKEYRGEDIRFCSAYLFGDSKFIEKRRPLAEAFNSMASVERPNIIYIRTDTNLKINGVDIGELTEKLTLAAFFGGGVQSIEMEPCDVVISENLSFFMAEKPKDAVFLYNKGFHLTNQIATFVKKLSYRDVYFFGDFDCQGFSILESLRERIGKVEFYPDIETVGWVLERYESQLPLAEIEECSEKRVVDSELLDFYRRYERKIEQEFLQVLFAKGGLKKPKWIM